MLTFPSVHYKKKQNLWATCETKGQFLWTYFDDMRFQQEFCDNFNENICFGENNCSPGTIRENMCKRGASAQGCLQKFDAFAKNYLF